MISNVLSKTNIIARRAAILFAIILLEGFVTISLEILTIRQLMPIVGNSVIVTSLIIGVFLLFLAYGYRRGGVYEANYQKVLKKNFTFAAIGLGIGLSYFFISYFFYFAEMIFAQNILVPLMIYLLLVTAPVVYLLGQTVPITFNLFQGEQRVGRLGGRVLHISTIGSFLGAVLTSVLLFNYLGVAWTVMVNFGVLVLLVLLLMDYRRDWLYLFVLGGAGLAIYGFNINVEKNFFVLTNSYANYRVVDNFVYPSYGTGRLLNVNDSYASFLGKKSQAFPYAERIKKILFDDLKLQNKQILVIGAGGFTLSAERDNQNTFTYVDIDPQIKAVAQKHFISHIRGQFVADDARHFLNKASQHYDVVIADAYSNRHGMPTHLLTREYFLSLQRVLMPNGVAIINLIARPTLDDAYSKRMDNTIRSVFRDCMAIPAHYAFTTTNILYFCRNSVDKADTMVYTDNTNRSTLDYFNLRN